MLPKTVRGAVTVAAVLAEEVGKRVVGTAAGLLEKGGVDVAGVERRLGGQFPPSAQTLQTLAEEAVTAGRAGVDLAVGVARGEVEKVFERVGDQVTKVGVVLAYLESKLREVEEEDAADREASGPAAPAPRAGGLFGEGWERETPVTAEAERIAVDEPVEVDPPVPPGGAPSAAPAPAVAEAAAPAAAAAAGAAAGAGKPAVKKPAVKKAAPAAGRTAPGERAAPAEKPAAPRKTTTAKKTAVKKTAARGSATAKKADGTGQEQPAKRTATRKTTVRRTTSAKKPDA
ncbi:hypothetical protein ACFCX4_13420 [Kitasatospora sp. NPDC056327]|uniref:hypothetical protein n=1 Tax=Kitasatospora sp. NPDC056327 TaxID=3345785 RepID=UPI0035E26531